MKSRNKDILIFGLALFSMYFGSGNVIFPPFLGLECGPQWLTGIISYMVSDILIAMLLFVAAIRIDGDVNSVTRPLGNIPGKMLLSIAIICIGPLFCIPRAGATTYDMLIVPIMGESNSMLRVVICSLIFFIISYLLASKPNNVCDIIGKFLTPTLIFFIMFMVIKGIITPIGEFRAEPFVDNVIKSGVVAGYESMEVFGGIPLVAILFATIREKGYQQKKEQIKIVSLTVLICFICLLVSSVGMTYLGASISTIYNPSISQAVLVVNIAKHLFGNLGGIILGLLAGLACLTTSVGVSAGAAKYFSETFPILKYNHIVLACTICGFALSCMGLKAIIAFAVPVLSLLYPVMVVMVVLSLFHYHIKKNSVYIGAALATLIISALVMLESLGIEVPFTNLIPFFDSGFGWVIPAVIGGIIGQIIGKTNAEFACALETK